jgi:hypothetical protein
VIFFEYKKNPIKICDENVNTAAGMQKLRHAASFFTIVFTQPVRGQRKPGKGQYDWNVARHRMMKQFI